MKMRKFEKGGFATSKDSEINQDRLGDFIATLDRVPVAAPGMNKTDDERAFPPPSPSMGKKAPIVTKEELAKSGLSLRDYMNKQQGLTRRQDRVNPDMGAKSDEAFLNFVKNRNQSAAVPADVSVARSEVKNTPNDLRAKSKELQARGAKLRSETSSVLGEYASEPEKPYRSKNLTDMLGLSSNTKKFAKGGVVSASSRGDGIAQRGKTRGKMC